MAFTGSAVVKKVSDSLYRVTGLSLATQGAAGTIGLSGGTGEVDLPDTVAWDGKAGVTLPDAIEVSIHQAEDVAVAPSVKIDKSGSTPGNFLATLTNGGAADTGDLEIYVRFML
jgi:hypothetical protein